MSASSIALEICGGKTAIRKRIIAKANPILCKTVYEEGTSPRWIRFRDGWLKAMHNPRFLDSSLAYDALAYSGLNLSIVGPQRKLTPEERARLSKAMTHGGSGPCGISTEEAAQNDCWLNIFLCTEAIEALDSPEGPKKRIIRETLEEGQD